jgi:hypothetical protein
VGLTKEDAAACAAFSMQGLKTAYILSNTAAIP